MFSARVPELAEPSPWASALAARRAAGEALLDLTDADPARCGLVGLEDAVALDAAPSALGPDPRGLASARAAVCAYYADRGGACDPDRVILTTGTSESYAHLFRLLADPGDTVAAPTPSYPLLEPLARAEGLKLAPYRIEWEGRWRLDPASVDAALEAGARAVIVVQPNHPTGSLLGADEILALDARCAAQGAALISDEVFGDTGWDSTGHELPSLLGDRAAPTFVMSGLSKLCGRPDLKLGWIAACGPETPVRRALGGLEWLADLFLSVGAPVQCALPALLAGRHAFQRRARERVSSNLERLRAHLARHSELALLAGDGGWVAVLRVPERSGEEALAIRLLEAGVVVHPGHFYDLERGAHLVVSLLVRSEHLEAGLARLGEVLAEA